ncbi:MAG: FAD-dependent oxidoreductase [SAR86 cluster bacterium]|nr:FAD-dependent oxidoreductase [SAR86 cluster bacterium]
MHIHVIGAGVVGLTTAYYLIKQGHNVTIIDQADSVAKGSSYANGGQLSYCLSDPLGKPNLFFKIPSVMFNKDPAIKFKPPKTFKSLNWSFRFLFECLKFRHKKNSLNLLELSLSSKSLFEEMLLNIGSDFSYEKSSKIVLYDNIKSLHQEISFISKKNQMGSDNKSLSMEEAINIEPAIATLKANFVGAIYSKSDEVGDSYLFCQNLYSWLLEQDARFIFNSKVTKINKHKNKISSLTINSQELEVQNIVICAGAYSDKLVDISFPIIPVRGYSITLPTGSLKFSKSLTITDKRMLFTKMGDKVRITGFADFLGQDKSLDQARMSQLLSLAKDIAPHLADYGSKDIIQWSGDRPLTPSSVPIIGPMNTKGIYVNTGQGFYGWTLACASGNRLAEFFK